MADFILRMRERHALRRQVDTLGQIVADRGFRWIGDRVVDLSQNGLLVRSASAVRVGESVCFSLRLPRGSSWIDGTGTVARIIHGKRATDSGRCIAIHFDPLDPAYRSLLHANLVRLPLTRAARRVRRDYASTIQLISGLHPRESMSSMRDLRF